jgi:hypothetical protein
MVFLVAQFVVESFQQTPKANLKLQATGFRHSVSYQSVSLSVQVLQSGCSNLQIAVAMVRGSDAIRAVLSNGIERAVSQWNSARAKA